MADSVEIKPPDFQDINITVIARIEGRLQFDLFIKRAENAFTRIFKKFEILDQERLENYRTNKGIGSLYVKRQDLLAYHKLVEETADRLFANAKGNSTTDLLETIKAMAEMTTSEITSSFPVDPQLVRHAEKTVQGCLALMGNDPKALPALFHLIGKNSYAVKHSLSCSIFAVLIAQIDGSLKSERSLLHLGLGGFLHDVGMTRVPFDPEEKMDLTAEEWAALKQHPELGARMLDSIRGVPSEVREIVLQHHEQPNGSGYPNSLHNQKIYFPAKIVALADAFSAMIQIRPFRDQAFSPQQALSIIKKDIGKYDPTLVGSLEKLVSPPQKG